MITVERLVMFGVIPILAAYGFMYIVTMIDPIRNGINTQTFITCLLAVYMNIGAWVYIIKKSNREMYSNMRGDGLSDDEIIGIIGKRKVGRIGF